MESKEGHQYTNKLQQQRLQQHKKQQTKAPSTAPNINNIYLVIQTPTIINILQHDYTYSKNENIF